MSEFESTSSDDPAVDTSSTFLNSTPPGISLTFSSPTPSSVSPLLRMERWKNPKPPSSSSVNTALSTTTMPALSMTNLFPTRLPIGSSPSTRRILTFTGPSWWLVEAGGVRFVASGSYPEGSDTRDWRSDRRKGQRYGNSEKQKAARLPCPSSVYI